ncbi:discoidin domain-containing protein [Paenibacillus zeirhizosphaerae]|uniref:discoidin domain-containing protein n=1 Tax=Paenibacillus zeirhizosphaerae TaxID=2987519 RepID=UPI002737A1B1|nr:discoidin domain-containing protein [Paenibacillus sp. P96]
MAIDMAVADPVEITETSSNGFLHPGIGVTKDILENMRAQIMAKQEPWYSYYKAMLVSSTASKTVTSSNQDTTNPTKPASDAFDSQGFNARFISDGLKAYTQALLYYITGDETYRANAMHIIRIWSQMDPAKYVYFADAHIHTGIPLNRMVTAAEILRYSSSQTEALKWTDQDTANFTNNLIIPVTETFLHDNNYFMNQHTYPLLGAMAGYIFTDNKDRYEEAIEWFTVNKTAKDQGINGSIQQLFRLVDTNAVTGEKLDQPVVQHVEMGRDQAHGAGDITNAAIISRMLLAQSTKVDPVAGTVSTAPDAVDIFAFLDHRILTAANYFWQYMLGYDTPWTPVVYTMNESGDPLGIYRVISDFYRGRMNTAQFWDIYYYYTYSKGVDLSEKAPYFYEAFTKRIPSNHYYQGKLAQAWESPDGGGDFWLYIPAEAVAEGAKYVPREMTSDALVEIEDRYTALDSHSATRQEGPISYVEITATDEGSTIVPLNLSFGQRTSPKLIGLKIRTNGTAILELSKERSSIPFHTITLPDTKGQWRYVTFDMSINTVPYAQTDENYSLMYMKVMGGGSKVDLDHLHVQAGSQLSAPVFKSGSSALHLIAFTGGAINADFSATDSNVSDVVTYEMTEGPAGAVLDGSTGAFTWTPTQTGTSSFIVVASDGTSVSTKHVKIEVTADRPAAVAAATAGYNPAESYVSATLATYTDAYTNVVNHMETDTDAAFYGKLQSLHTAVGDLELLNKALPDGSLDYVNMVSASSFGNYLPSLTDDNDNSYVAYGLAPDQYHTLDFGSKFNITAQAFEVQGRRSFPERIAGLAVFGSNDGDNWTRLTDQMTVRSEEKQRLAVKEEYNNTPFRFFKLDIIEPQSTMFEIGELRIYGQRHEVFSKLSAVSISSEQSLKNRIVTGDTVKLDFKAIEPIQDVKVLIQGQEAAAVSTDNMHWTAQWTVSPGAGDGKVRFSINYKLMSDGSAGDEAFLTTDSTHLFITDESQLIPNVTDITYLLDPTTAGNRTPAETIKQAGYLFDGDPSTNSDFRLGSNGAGGFITFDFKADQRLLVTKVELLARQDQYYGRIKGAVVQGSNDNENWSNLTSGAAALQDWQTFTVSNTTPYRYIRIYNSGSWFGNMAELRLHGSLQE